MTAQTNLDAPTIARLAVADPAMAHLASALPEGGFGAASLHDVVWSAGSGCRIAYRRRRGDELSSFEAVTVSSAGWYRQDFRDDPALPGLRRAADPASVGALLSCVVGRPVESVAVEPVRYRPGSRCVLRYAVTTPGKVRTFYGKVLAHDAFTRVAPLVVALEGHPDWPGIGSPLAALWPELCTVVTEAAAGVSASSVLRDPARSPEEGAQLAHRIGELLARLHGVEGVEAPRWTAPDQVSALRASVRAAAAVDPDLGDRLNQLIDRLETRLPAPGTDVLSHGGFRAGQVVVRPDGTLTLLDVDGLCLSDRGRDLGTALAHLFWSRARRRSATVLPDPVEEALLAGYRARAGGTSLDALPWWQTAGLLQVAVRRYGRLETSDWPAVPLLVDAAGWMLHQWESQPVTARGTDLLDVASMSSLLAPLLCDQATEGQAPVIASAERLSTAEGRRTVVRYTLRSGRGGVPEPVIAKVFTESVRAMLLHETLRLLSEGPFRHGDLSVPEPLGVIPAQRLVLFRQTTARPISDLTGSEAVLGVRRASQWLVRLHSSDVRLPRQLSVADEARSVSTWARLIGRTYPELDGPARSLAAAWAEAVLKLPPPSRQAAIHKDFHAGHVLVGERVCVIDLDEARHGDPSFDLAHFATYLEAVGDGQDRTGLREAFLQAYVDATGWSDEGSFGPYCAYTWLKVAKQRATGGGPYGAVPPALRRSSVEMAIKEGERCLDR